MTSYLVRIELRRRRWSFLVLALVTAAVVGVVLASLAGARRAETAFDRYLEDYNSPSAAAFSFSDDGDGDDLAVLDDLEPVDQAIDFELVGATPVADPEGFYPLVVSEDGALPFERMRAPVMEGRYPHRDAPHEVALSERTARRLDAPVGSEVELATFSPESLEAEMAGEGGEPDGPAITLDVVGIVRDPGDIGARESDITLTFLTPAFRDAHPRGEVGSISEGTMVVLADGHTLAEVSSQLEGANVELDTSMSPDSSEQQITPTLDAIATSTRLFGLVAALAGLIALGQAITRLHLAACADDRTLDALGAGHRVRWRRLFVPAIAATFVGVGLGVLVALALSTRFPVGLARKADPDLGFHADISVLLFGALVAAVVLALLTGLLASWRVRQTDTQVEPAPVSRWARTMADLGAPPPAVTGLSLASGTPGRPGRIAVGGTLLSVLGVLATLVFSASVDRLAEDPELFGWGWDAAIEGADLTDLGGDAPVVGDALAEDPDVLASAPLYSQMPVSLDDVPLYATAVDSADAALRPIVVRGALPTSADEVAVGRDDLDEVGTAVGDEVDLVFAGERRTVRITGLVAFPVPEDGGSSATGVYLSPTFDQGILDQACVDSDSCTRTIAVALRDDADRAAFADRYQDDATNVDVALPRPPGEVDRLIAVEDLPRYLAIFLAALAATAVSFATATTIRQRRRDLAVLRVLGMTGRHVRTVVVVLVFALTAAGAFLGGILGLIVGRQVWRAVADSVALPFSPSLPVMASVLVPLAAVLLAQVVASTSRRAAGRVPAALVLRAE